MDVNLAIKFAQLVNAAYALDPKNTGSLAGQPITAGGMGYAIVTTVFANDLATEIMPGRSAIIVPIGLVLRAGCADAGQRAGGARFSATRVRRHLGHHLRP